VTTAKHMLTVGRGTAKALRNGNHDAAVLLGSMGGKARLKTMTAKRRCEIARKAAKARWAKRGKK
jgi:hypothetical protein